jgi:recombination protein RecA
LKTDKTYGKGTVMKMGDKAIVEVETISSGS